MLYITHTLPLSSTFPTAHHCFLDLETTGLSKQHDFLICLGLASRKGETLYIEQWLLENGSEEKDLLHLLMERLSAYNKIYTYGGKHFEWPFFIEKLQAYGLDSSFLTTCHLVDLKPSKAKRSILEMHIGFHRIQTTSGKELAKLAKLLLQGPNPSYATLILEHNKEELLSLQAIFNYTQFMKQLSPSILQDSHLDTYRVTFTLKPLQLYNTSFKGSHEEEGVAYHYDATTGLMFLYAKARHLQLKAYLPPKDYYFVEGKLLHKSLAKLLPTSMRQKATKDTCYLEQTGYYLPFV
ncbi:MAG: ribonuclease H-like domain-containing protein, partial [Niameybacter sp.]